MTAFSSLSEFLAMGGHAAYVWAAWGVTFFMLLASVWHARLERRRVIKTLKRRARREKRHAVDSNAAVKTPGEPVNES